MDLQIPHWFYLACVIICLFVNLKFKRDVSALSLLMLFVLSMIWLNGNVIGSLVVLYNGIYQAIIVMMDLIILFTVARALTKAMEEQGSIYLLAKPIQRGMINPTATFWMLVISSLIFSWICYPSPASAIMAATVIPVALAKGFPPIWTASASNLPGHGWSVTGPIIILSVPAMAANVMRVPQDVVVYNFFIIGCISGIVATVVAYVLMKYELRKSGLKLTKEVQSEKAATPKIELKRGAKFIAVIFFIAIIGSIAAAVYLKQPTTQTVGGALAILTFITSIVGWGTKEGSVKFVEFLTEGFVWTLKIFAVIIPVVALFLTGSPQYANAIIGASPIYGSATGFLQDLGVALTQVAPLNKYLIVLILSVVGAVSSWDGVGLDIVPLLGTMSLTLGNAIGANYIMICSIAWMWTAWFGIGTILPWSKGVVAYSGICKLSPQELARKNLIPTFAGLIVGTIIGLLFT